MNRQSAFNLFHLEVFIRILDSGFDLLDKTCVLFEQIIKKSSLERIDYDLTKARATIM